MRATVSTPSCTRMTPAWAWWTWWWTNPASCVQSSSSQTSWAGLWVSNNNMYHLFLSSGWEKPFSEKCHKIYPFISGIAGMIVAVGLVTLFLWKTFTTISDRKEFARFEEERMKMKFNANSNPIFKQATTTIQNPMFCKEPYWFQPQTDKKIDNCDSLIVCSYILIPQPWFSMKGKDNLF